MITQFIISEIKLVLSWVNAFIFTIISKVGFSVDNYELWKIVTIDILTVISLIVAIGYTISRWKKLNKDRPTK